MLDGDFVSSQKVAIKGGDVPIDEKRGADECDTDM